MTEVWRDIPGYDGCYQASTEGRVRSWKYGTPARMLKPGRVRGGYLHVSLRDGSAAKNWRLGRLILLTFMGQPPPGMEACHRDGDRTNNRLSNLRWDTTLGNYADRRLHGTVGRKLTDEDVLEMRRLHSDGLSSYKLASLFGVSQTCAFKASAGVSFPHLPMPGAADD